MILNKSDVKAARDRYDEFYQLGFKQMFEISSQHGIGIAELLDEVVAALPLEHEEVDEKPEYKVVLIGKPNVGKSSLMNILIKEDRSLVSDIPGTTREAISSTISFYKETIKVTDTAGLRRKSSINETIEQLMVKSSLTAVKEADVVVLLIDGHEGKLAQQEIKLLAYAFDANKAVIILRNKADLLDEAVEAEWKFETSPYEYFLKKVEIMTISCKTGHNIGKILPLIKEVWERYNIHFSATELTVLFKEGLQYTPLYKGGNQLKLFSAKQFGKRPRLLVLFFLVSRLFRKHITQKQQNLLTLIGTMIMNQLLKKLKKVIKKFLLILQLLIAQFAVQLLKPSFKILISQKFYSILTF